MSKKFHFDDEETQQISDTEEFDILRATPTSEENQADEESVDEGKKKMSKKKFVWKWWHYVLIVLTVLFISFSLYIFLESRNNGPVYGERCDGIVAIPNDLRKAAIDTAQNKYSDIESLTMETACKQLKVNIVFKANTKTNDAIKISEDVVKILDDLVGKPKENGKTYSTLFGSINNVPQYEVNFFLLTEGNADFPIYGTKHIQRDKFSYTFASVRDEKSKNAAEETLKDVSE